MSRGLHKDRNIKTELWKLSHRLGRSEVEAHPGQRVFCEGGVWQNVTPAGWSEEPGRARDHEEYASRAGVYSKRSRSASSPRDMSRS
ncbi:hypothetical protein MPTK1_6g16710 [Marchantia polymorpha subsp. ruderalis]|uniref:Uncharacterized protein n=2 Tax=Marchantia polymorpha TaxID=3197 RepID=A0AAF6BST5_MARPO|nr:hypothetical protein MARPO_0170s0006 [Marchantia polymorpha]BBN15069.1 hypothetical protein Mp_6g16710 [Marchantia polymorpha subsp. ruderalis]|eukprot:PTQ28198.1 hypothetical protein MARPO_0170s0006 [Marchantia polymorpha]